MNKEGTTTYRRLRGRRRYLDASSEEGSISAPASKKVQSRFKLRRTRRDTAFFLSAVDIQKSVLGCRARKRRLTNRLK